jgi:hypothetical protein
MVVARATITDFQHQQPVKGHAVSFGIILILVKIMKFLALICSLTLKKETLSNFLPDQKNFMILQST